MGNQKFGVDIDLQNNQLINSRAENGAGFTSAGVTTKGRFMFDTAQSRLLYDDGSNIQIIANLNDLTGLLDFKGGYNATTNTPTLTSGSGIFKGDYYVVTIAGTFFGAALEIGDSLFANVDSPTVLSQWTLVQGNIINATEIISGVIRISTQAETDAGVNDSAAITALKLKNASYISKSFLANPVTIGSGLAVTVTHGLNTLYPSVETIRISTNERVFYSVLNYTLNTIDLIANGTNHNVAVRINN